MPCCSNSSAAKDRCAFTSLALLGAMVAMQASPCGRPSLLPLFMLLGFIPLVTFRVIAPSRLGLGAELRLLARGLEAMLLGGALWLAGRRDAAATVRARHRLRVEQAYRGGETPVADGARLDPLRLHHARRLASVVTGAVVLAGLALPILQPDVFTFGDGAEAPFVALLDLLTLGWVGRIVAERIAIKLFEMSATPPTGRVWRRVGLARTVGAYIGAVFGLSMGAIGALVVVGAAAVASALETAWLADGVSMAYAAAWFIRQTSLEAIAFGAAVGAILGAGICATWAITRTRTHD